MSNTRKAAAGVGGLATVLLLLLLWPMFVEGDPLFTGDLRTWATWIFWNLAIVLIVVLFFERNVPGATKWRSKDPAFARFLFNNRRAGLFWLPIRVFVGAFLAEAGLHKLTGRRVDEAGSLKGYWQHAVAIPDPGRRPSPSSGTATSSTCSSTTTPRPGSPGWSPWVRLP